jgi:peptidoglycan-N-acetylglucosamine deacetylase
VIAESALLVGATGAFFTYAARGKSASIFEPSIWHGPRSDRAVALTFDDGPSESTPRFLDLLDGYGVRGTFFVCGANVQRLPKVAKAIVDRGHEIGNHGFDHSRLWLRSPAVIADQVERTQKIVQDVTGTSPRWFRAPFGVRWFGLGSVLKKNQMTGVMWTLIANDWSLRAYQIEKRLMRGMEPGAIICLHDGRELETDPDVSRTFEATKRYVPHVLGHRYRIKSLSEWSWPKNSPRVS